MDWDGYKRSCKRFAERVGKPCADTYDRKVEHNCDKERNGPCGQAEPCQIGKPAWNPRFPNLLRRSANQVRRVAVYYSRPLISHGHFRRAIAVNLEGTESYIRNTGKSVFPIPVHCSHDKRKHDLRPARGSQGRGLTDSSQVWVSPTISNTLNSAATPLVEIGCGPKGLGL